MTKLKNLLLFNKFFIIILVFIIIYVLVFTKFITYKSKYNINDTYFEGKITNYAINGDKLSLDIKAKEKLKGTYYFKTKEEKEYWLNNICIGCTIKINGTLTESSNNTIPNTFNYKKYLYNKKIYYTINISDFKINKDNNILAKIKDYFYKRTNKLPNSDYLKIFILGDKSLISSEDYNEFQINGVSHLLAISGMHIGILLKILDILLSKMKLTKKTIVISLILFFFAFLTNFASSILRAVLFYCLLNVKKIFNLKISNFKVLLLTAGILIIINPFIIYDIGFIYSFVITGGIILNTKLIKGSYLRQLFTLSLISFLFSLPITISLNYEINLTSIIANLIFVPFISLVVYPLALLTFIFTIFSSIFNISLNILSFFNHIFDKLSFLIVMPKMNVILIVIYYLFLLLSFKIKKLFIVVLLIIIINKFIPKIDSSYYIYYLDVGQGDSAVLISSHQKEVIMIDTGGKITYEKEDWQKSTKSYNLSDNTLKFLKSLGISKINKLIITHGDNDHGGEALNIINNFKVEKIILNSNSFNALEKSLIKTNKVTKTINSSNFNMYSLNNYVSEDENESSLVLYFKINNYGFLFMGDAPKMVEEKIISKYKLNPLVLKVGHHGSNTSSSSKFINTIKPTYSVISVGKNNRYGHPNEETITNLSNSKIYRTDIDGTIMFKIKNNNFKINTYAP